MSKITHQELSHDFFRRLGKANNRGTGMHINADQVFHLSSVFADAIANLEKAND